MIKAHKLLLNTPRGIVLLNSWLEKQGYSRKLIDKYRKSGLLKSIGFGAHIMGDDNVDIMGAIYALQNQMSSTIHVSGRSSLDLQGKGHYLDLNPQRIVLFISNKDKKVPKWFKDYNWGIKPIIHVSDFLPNNMGMIEFKFKEFHVLISNEVRAIMECLYLMPNDQEPMECYELMESLNNLNPKSVQAILEKCSSKKVKRLFLYLAEKINHAWYKYIDHTKIDLGTGIYNVVENGVYDKKYKLMVPKSWGNKYAEF